MALAARHGILGDGRIRMDGRRTRVDRDTGGWYVVRGGSPSGDARVLYRGTQDLGVIQWPGTILRISFHAGEGEFVWEGRSYRIASMIAGVVDIREQGRTVAQGHVTTSGLRLDTVATELVPIIRPLAWALVLRSEFVAEGGRGAAVV